MTEQLRIIDINQYWRTGGIDYPELRSSCDYVIIQAYNGAAPNPILKEQVDGCEEHDILYETYCIPNPNIPGDEMAEIYLELYGVWNRPKWLDAERVSGQMASQFQMREFKKEVDDNSKGKIGYYSNYPRTMELGNPIWIRDMDVWWAHYLHYWNYNGYIQYRTFEKYLKDHPWYVSKWAAKLGISPILHQFTEKGDAQLYGAKQYTNDPKFKVGIKSADLNVGLITHAEYYKKRFGPFIEVPDDPPLIKCPNTSTINNHELRIQRLEQMHTNPDDEEPETPTELGVKAIIFLDHTDKTRTPAWAITEWNTNKDGDRIPVIETNYFAKTGDPTYVFENDEEVQVYPKAIIADGGHKFYEIAKANLPVKLFLRKEHVMKFVEE